MSRIEKAFTLTELLVCIAIIAVISGITYPAFAGAKHSAKVTQAKSNLKQIFAGCMLYAQDQDEHAEYGSPSQMGLYTSADPMGEYPVFPEYGLTEDLRLSPCGDGPLDSLGRPYVFVIYFPTQDVALWNLRAPKYPGRLPIASDLSCGGQRANLYDPFTRHTAYWITTNGTLSRRQGHMGEHPIFVDFYLH